MRERPPLRLRRRLTGIGLGLLGVAGFLLLSRAPGVAEVLYGRGPIPELTRALSRLSGRIPFSLAEIVVLGVLLRQGAGVARGAGQLRREEDEPLRTLGRGGLRLAQDIGVLVFLFYLLWGFQYARPGVEGRLGIEASGEVGTEELRELAVEAVEAGNRLYQTLHGSSDVGTPTPSTPPAELVPALEVGWAQAVARWELDRRMERRYGGPKSFLATPLLKRMGVAGMYFPYTGEALVLSDLPGAARGKEMAHEMAHQRGVARESDANILGYLVAAETPDPRVRYAAALFIQRQLIGALARADRDLARAVSEEREPGVRRDLEALAAYWTEVMGPVSEATTRLNHTMLRSHGIPEGVENYRGSVWAFAALARREGVRSVLP